MNTDVTTSQMTEVIIEEQPINEDIFVKFMQEGRAVQNIYKGILGGIIAAILGAGLWAMITVLTGYQIGWMAIGVGFMVGYGVKVMGKGVDNVFGVVGASMALLGCIGGNILMIIFILFCNYGYSLSSVDAGMLLKVMTKYFDPIDLIFYAIALYEGFRLSINRLELE